VPEVFFAEVVVAVLEPLHWLILLHLSMEALELAFGVSGRLQDLLQGQQPRETKCRHAMVEKTWFASMVLKQR
jgi:hypothetical protein